jgi:hypothetical protein
MGFEENFQREEAEKLKYDTIAFFYFAFSMLVVILTPATFFLVIKPMTVGEMIIKTTSIKNCQCKLCVERMKKR